MYFKFFCRGENLPIKMYPIFTIHISKQLIAMSVDLIFHIPSTIKLESCKDSTTKQIKRKSFFFFPNNKCIRYTLRYSKRAYQIFRDL